jgi:hypothetical protein
MQLLAPFVRSIRSASSRAFNIVTSPLPTLNYMAIGFCLRTPLKGCGAFGLKPQQTQRLRKIARLLGSTCSRKRRVGPELKAR